MPTLKYVVLFHALACSLCNASTYARLEDNQARINVTDHLPNYAGWVVNFQCDSGRFNLTSGQEYQWQVPIDRADKCTAVLGRAMASFNAYAPQYDKGNAVVYWVVRLDGFYHSWDSENWVKKAEWGP